MISYTFGRYRWSTAARRRELQGAMEQISVHRRSTAKPSRNGGQKASSDHQAYEAGDLRAQTESDPGGTCGRRLEPRASGRNGWGRMCPQTARSSPGDRSFEMSLQRILSLNRNSGEAFQGGPNRIFQLLQTLACYR